MAADRKRAVLAVSLALIAVSWSLTLVSSAKRPRQLPGTFAALLVAIAIRKAVTFGLIAALLRAGGERWRDIGLGWRDAAAPTLRGSAYGTVIFALINVGLSSLAASVIGPSGAGPAGSLTTFFRSPVNLMAWIPVGVLAGGLVEEAERAFTLTRFERLAGPTGLYVGVVLSSIEFGAAHLYQSRSSAVTAAVSGLVFALIYLRRRSCVEAAAAHASADVLSVIAATVIVR